MIIYYFMVVNDALCQQLLLLSVLAYKYSPLVFDIAHNRNLLHGLLELVLLRILSRPHFIQCEYEQEKKHIPNCIREIQVTIYHYHHTTIPQ